MSTPRIHIVGGGIGGLALAAALDPARWQVTVHERRPERRGAPTALGMWPGAMRALGRIGLDEAVRSDGVPVGTGRICTADGRPVVRLAAKGLTLIGRTRLVELLEAAVPPSVVRVTEGVDDPAALLADGADWVVGADGAHSMVRRTAFPGAVSRPTPYLAVRGVQPDDRTRRGFAELWGDGCLVGIGPLGPGRLNWFTSFRSELGPDHVDVGEALREAGKHLGGHPADVRQLLARAHDGIDAPSDAPVQTLAQRIWVGPPLRRYRHGRYLLIGDAAHAMTPNLGRGACEALVDALTLARALESPRPDRSLGRWEARRVPATRAMRAGSERVMRTALGESWRPARFGARTPA